MKPAPRDLGFWLATWGGAGLIRPAPGTWGSLAALPFAYGFYWIGGWAGVLIAAVALFLIGVWACHQYSKHTDKVDASEIVIDEVVGQFIALLPALIFVQADWPAFLLAFVLFRAFDILKPWPISLADRRHDAFGVMLDDVLAGLFAALVGWGILYFAY